MIVKRVSPGQQPFWQAGERSVKPSAQPTMVRIHHLPPPAKTTRKLGIRPPRGPACVVSSCVIVGQETSPHHAGHGHIADGVRPGGAVHRTACLKWTPTRVPVGTITSLRGADTATPLGPADVASGLSGQRRIPGHALQLSSRHPQGLSGCAGTAAGPGPGACAGGAVDYAAVHTPPGIRGLRRT
jgi:hypothetical protein